MTPKLWKSRLAISLAELLVVLGLIGILALIALPQIVGVPAGARDAVARETMERLNRAVNAHRMSNAAPLPSETGGEDSVFSALTTRDANIPGTPFYRTEQDLVLSSNTGVHRFAWTGVYFQILAPGTSGSGLALPDD